MTRRDALPPLSFVLTSAAFVVGMALLALWAAWPIYQTWFLAVTVGGAIALAAGISWLGLLRGWSWLTVLLVTVGAYLVFGVPLAVPSALGGIADVPAGFVSFLAATVFGWKELVTIALPVGTYQALLVPVFLTMLAGGVAAFSLAWRAPRASVLVVPIGFAMQLFGLAFGSSEVSRAVSIAGLSVSAPRETLIGILGFLLAIGFLVWRARYARTAALRRASSASGVRRRRLGWPSRARQAALAGLAILVAVAIAVPVTATVLPPAPREVLRTSIDPTVELREQLSPLAQYRSYFTEEWYDAELFTVAGAQGEQHLRLAVLSYYDGQVFRVVDPQLGEQNQGTAFSRLPFAHEGGSQQLEFTVGDYSGVWLPTASSLASIRFEGDNRQNLADGFFYNSASDAGLQLSALEAGDRYTVQSRAAEKPIALGTLKAPVEKAPIDEALLPESLVEWVRAQKVGSDAAGLQELLTRLRERGFLSHSLAAPAGAQGWAAGLGDYSFEPSLAGHSVDRIGTLFTALLEKQKATSSTENSALVAAVGDDEQFAAAAALIARYLGFSSRVVLGFAVGEGSAEADGIPACDAGVCRGQNLSAWVEVGDSAGAWAPVAVTPQHENSLAPRDDERRDPQNDTEVAQNDATELQPPEANPAGGDEQQRDDETTGLDLGWLWGILRVAGSGVLILLVPFTPVLAILLAKWRRRRERRGATDAATSIAGGWDEFVDTAIDHGHSAPGHQTRAELAASVASPGAPRLAALADAAVFGAPFNNPQAGAEFWRLVESEQAALQARSTRWGRLRAALSVRSFTRFLSFGRGSGAGKVK